MLALALVACGGGGGGGATPTNSGGSGGGTTPPDSGGGGGGTPAPAPTNGAPSFTSNSASAMANELGTGTDYTASASDPEGGSVSYSLAQSGDYALFNLTNGALSFKARPDYEAPPSGKTNYSLTIIARDSGGAEARQNVSLTLVNVNETPSFGSNTSGTGTTIAENSTGNTLTIYTAPAATDPEGDTLTYQLIGTDAHYFTINANRQIAFRASPDFEEKASYSFIVLARDNVNGHFATHSVTTSITDDPNETMIETSGNILAGTAGADALTGGTGDDRLTGYAGSDRLDGGAGIDTADYSDKTSAVEVDLTSTKIIYPGETVAASWVRMSVGGTEEDYIKNIENIIGGSAGDTLTGDGNANVLMGGAGSDRLDGGAGIDTADYSDKTSAVVVDLTSTKIIYPGETEAASWVRMSVGGTNEDYIKNIENIIGGSAGDTLTGDGNANVLEGGAGDDVIRGGAGNDRLTGGAGLDTLVGGAGNDIIYAFDDPSRNVYYGGTVSGNRQSDGEFSGQALAGIDTISYENFSAGVTIVHFDSGSSGGGAAAGDGMYYFANIIGGSGDDTLTHNATIAGLRDNVLEGRAGNDTLSAGAGDDTLAGGIGDDTLNGGAGIDALYGGTGDDTLNGGAGNDTLIGGIGDDRLTGEAGNDMLYGGAGSDIVRGGAGDDRLDGGAGVDTLIGGAGDDIIYADATSGPSAYYGGIATISSRNAENGQVGGSVGSSGIDTISYENLSQGVTISISLFTITTGGAAANDYLSSFMNMIGGAGNDNLADTRTGAVNVNVLDGRAGDDTLSGGGGADTLIGGAGNDIFVLELASGSRGADVVSDFASGDKVQIDAPDSTAFSALQTVDFAQLASGETLHWVTNSTTNTRSIGQGNASTADTVFFIDADNDNTLDSSETVVLILEDYNTALTANDFDIV